MEQRSQLTAEAERVWVRPIVVVPVFVFISAVAGLFPSFSLSANLLVLAVGGTLFWLGFTGKVPKRPGPGRLTKQAAWWLAPALFLAIVELVNFGFGSTYEHPTLSLLADPLLTDYLVRSTVYFGWLAAFWGLIRR
jgi:hypothetical protein